METNTNVTGKFLDPEAIIAQLGLPLGGLAADFGCGPGYFSIPFAQALGENGTVYSLDVLPQALETVESKAKNTSGAANIITKRVNVEKEGGSKLDSESLDWVIMKDMLFQNKKRDVIVREAYRVLKPGGRVIVVEWGAHDSGIGPDKEDRVDEAEIKRIFQEEKFSIERPINAGDFHYAFIALK